MSFIKKKKEEEKKKNDTSNAEKPSDKVDKEKGVSGALVKGSWPVG